MALGAINAPKINSMFDQTPQAEAVRNWFYVDRDAFVQESRWTFARKSVVLTPTTYADNNWVYAYIYPQDCLNIDELRPPNLLGNDSQAEPSIAGVYPGTGGPYESYDIKNIPHEICQLEVNGTPTGQQVILCNIPSAILVYTRQITDPNQWPITFLKAFTYYLALDLAGDLQTATGIVNEVQNKFSRACPIAKRVSVNEVTDNSTNVSRIEKSRRGGWHRSPQAWY